MAKRETSVGSMTPAQATAIAETYFAELRDIRGTRASTPETSYYPALANLFNTVGKALKPRVRCVMNLKDQGADNPDGGLFTPDQSTRQASNELRVGLLPSRGAIEAKSPRENVRSIAGGDQVRKYLNLYGIVLVTNLRDFLIVERGADQQPRERESFSLADNEKTFWQVRVAHPRATAEEKGAQFIEFIKRACLHNAPLQNPKEVAWFLASYAKDALARVEQRRQLPALQAVRSALEEALGMKFTGEKGEHFFRSTLVQTLFYGIFSAWVLWHRENPNPRAEFDWRKAEWTLHIPFIQTLYEEIAKASQLGPLGLVEVLDWAGAVLNRVNRDEFFQHFADEQAVQYFYEPFLEAYDPQLRKELGVWYTPPEIVKYQVARVDRVLREELGLADGLADPSVIILDPCCGTGAYLVEVLHSIARTLRNKGGDALVSSDLKQAAKSRVFGFEILPAPFVVAHLQLGLMLQGQGAPLSQQRNERVGVYLTNALTGWEAKGQAPIPHRELEEERRRAGRVKREERVLVVLGNPPYNAFAGTSPEEEEGLVEVYKGAYEVPKKRRGIKTSVARRIRYDRDGKPIRESDTVTRYRLNDPVELGGWAIRKFNLDDLYVRFFRLAERRIAEITGRGVVSFISNFSYLGDPSFVVMRQRFLAEFDKLWLDCMNGDSRQTGKLTPDGKPDPSVFSTEYNREGIRVGTAVCVIVRKPAREAKAVVRFRHFWGADKRADLLASVEARRFDSAYAIVGPNQENRYSFRPESVAPHYADWPKITELCAVAPFNGLMEKRGGALIDIDRARLESRMRDYFDRGLTWDEYRARQTALTEDAARYDAKATRRKAIAAESFDVERLQRYTIRPFDTRWCYYTGIRPVWNEPRPALWSQHWEGNSFLMVRPTAVAVPEGVPLCFTRALGDNDALRGHAYYVPLLLRNGDRLEKRAEATLFSALGDKLIEDAPVANLSGGARTYLLSLGFRNVDNIRTARLLWLHMLAIGFSPVYLGENADGIRRDWLRIPVPAGRKALEASATLGEQIAKLLDTENGVPGVTCGKVTPLFRAIGLITKTGGGQLNSGGSDLAITARWGVYQAQGGAVMPGEGRCQERRYDDDEATAIDAEARACSISSKDARQCLGEETCDVYLNPIAYWRNIPSKVWDYHIGGYQVIKKWLSYREAVVLQRAIRPEEAREVMNMARRIAAIILLQPQLDANYLAVKNAAYA